MAICFVRVRGQRTKPRMRLQHVAPRISVGYAVRCFSQGYTDFERQIDQEFLCQQSIQKKIQQLEWRYEKAKQELELLHQSLFSLQKESVGSTTALLEVIQQEALLNKSLSELKQTIDEYQSRNSGYGWQLIATAIAAIAVCTLLAPVAGAVMGGEVLGVAAGSEISFSLGLVLTGEGASLSLTPLGVAAGGIILASTKDKDSVRKDYSMVSVDPQQKKIETPSKDPNAKEHEDEKNSSQKVVEKVIVTPMIKKMEKEAGLPVGNFMDFLDSVSEEKADGSLSPYRDKLLKGSILFAQSYLLPGTSVVAEGLDLLAKNVDPGPSLEDPALQESFKKCLVNASSMEDC